MGKNDCCNLLRWQLKQLKRVAQSSSTAETIALLDVVEVALYMKELLYKTYRVV